MKPFFKSNISPFQGQEFNVAHPRKVPATEYRRPVELLYYEACRSEAGARIREKQLKTGFGRRYLKTRLLE